MSVTDCFGSDAEPLAVSLCLLTSAAGFYFTHKSGIDATLAQGKQSWDYYIAQQAHPGVAARMLSDSASVITATPYFTVEAELSPCGGANTIKIRYKKDGSEDCANPAATHAVKLGDSSLVFIDTVDSNGHPNNAMVYQFSITDSEQGGQLSQKFLGVMTQDDHPAFRMNYAGDDLTMSYDNPDGSREECFVHWRGRIAEDCARTRF
jgi:hypothetical protein